MHVFRRSTLVLLAVLGLCAGIAVAEDAQTLFMEGVELYDLGEFGEAKAKFQEVLRLDPHESDAKRMVEQAGHNAMIRLLVDENLGIGPSVIWGLYRKAVRRDLRDETYVRKLVDKAVDPDTHPRERTKAIYDLRQVGQFAMTFLGEHLANKKNEEIRANARVAITSLGSNATLALIELLDHPNRIVVSNAATALGNLVPADHRAVAPLKAVVDSTSASTEITKWAGDSLSKITGLEVSTMQSAGEYYLRKADRYLRELAGVPREAREADGVIWHVDSDGKLARMEVPLYAWNELMAEQACYDAMEADPSLDVALVTLAATMATQYAETKELLDIAGDRPPGRIMSDEEVGEIEEARKKLEDALIIIRACGADHVYAAVAKCLADAETDNRVAPALAACVLIDAVKDLDPRGDLLPRTREKAASRRRKKGEKTVAVGGPLVEALSFRNRRVSYAAAIALAHMDPIHTFPGAGLVCSTLGDAIAECGPSQLLIVSEDGRMVGELRGKLESAGFGVSVASSARDGVAEAKRFPRKEMILASAGLQADGVDTAAFLKKLSADERSAATPVIILSSAGDYEEDKAKFTDQEVLDWNRPSSDWKRILEEAVTEAGSLSSSKERAEGVAVAAAVALGGIDPVHTHMKPQDAGPACIGALRNRPDALRIACIKALGRFSFGEAMPDIEELFKDPQNSFELRSQCLSAVANIKPESAFTLLREVERDETEFTLRFLAGLAYGRGKPGNEGIIEFVRQARIDKALKEE